VAAAHYRADYEALFGPLPTLSDLPADAGPLGSADERAAWQALTQARRDDVSRVFANRGKAIAAYEKTLQHGPSRFDRYAVALAQGDEAALHVLTPAEVNGLRLFIGKGQCVSCHNGPLFTDQAFHNTGVPQRDAARADRGRAAALATVRQDEFNCLGRFSDARPEDCGELAFMSDDSEVLEGAFKTPGLRGVAERAPYRHAGQFASLDDVVRHYVKAPAATVGRSELVSSETRGDVRGERHGGAAAGRRAIRLSAEEARDVVAFLGTLSGPGVETGPDSAPVVRASRRAR
jgi:cytochrome c peroxidase